jgi:hypothetical protein
MTLADEKETLSGVNDTSEQIVTGVFDTGIGLDLKLRQSQRIFEICKMTKYVNQRLRGNISMKNAWVKNLVALSI